MKQRQDNVCSDVATTGSTGAKHLQRPRRPTRGTTSLVPLIISLALASKRFCCFERKSSHIIRRHIHVLVQAIHAAVHRRKRPVVPPSNGQRKKPSQVSHVPSGRSRHCAPFCKRPRFGPFQTTGADIMCSSERQGVVIFQSASPTNQAGSESASSITALSLRGRMRGSSLKNCALSVVDSIEFVVRSEIQLDAAAFVRLTRLRQQPESNLCSWLMIFRLYFIICQCLNNRVVCFPKAKCHSLSFRLHKRGDAQ